MTSIVIPHFNRSQLIAETLASVEAQTCGDWEAIIVDDGSNPEERIALNAYASDRVKILDRQDGEKGPSRCRNLGATAARGDFLLFLDSDDLLSQDCLEQRLRAADLEPAFDLWVFPVANFKHHIGDLDVLWGTMSPGGDDARRFASGDAPWHTSSPLWRRQAFLSLGGFNERISYGDDADLHLRTILGGLRIRQFADVPPDAFVRRSTVARITNTLDPAALRARRIRLEEGTQMLKSSPDGKRLWSVWEGQYFVEAEFLLFNFQSPRIAISSVLLDWEKSWTPGRGRRMLVHAYFNIGIHTRRKAYLAVRIARKLAMQLLPREYFGANLDDPKPFRRS